MQRRTEAATLLQASARGFLVRRLVLPKALSERCERELAEGRVRLEAALRDLRRTCHSLAYLEGDRERAAARLQAWWRTRLIVRITSIMQIHRKLLALMQTLDYKATSIQRRYRGHIVRKLIEHVRVEKEERDRKAEQAQSERTNRLATRIQAVARSMMASREVSSRRKTMRLTAGELPWDVDVGTSSPTASNAGTLSNIPPLVPSPRSERLRARRNSEFPATLLLSAMALSSPTSQSASSLREQRTPKSPARKRLSVSGPSPKGATGLPMLKVSRA